MYWRSIRTAVGLVGFGALAARPCAAQSVQGMLILDKSHAPVGLAHVELVDDSGQVVARDISDSASGAFALIAPRPGRYEVRIIVGRGGESSSPPFQLDSAQVVERAFAVPDWPRTVLDAYPAEDVTRRATIKPTGFRAPRYPDGLRSAGRTGVVRARFVVDRQGRADMSTFQVLESDDYLFTRSVREAVARGEFVPAELNGAPVPQLFEMDVDFRFDNTPFRLHGNNVFTITATPPY